MATSERDAAYLGQIEADLDADGVVIGAKARVASVSSKVESHQKEMTRLSRASGSVAAWQADQSGWWALKDEIANEQSLLTAAILRLDERKRNLEEIDARWIGTLNSTDKANLPLDVGNRVKALIERTEADLKRIGDQRKAILSLQGKLAGAGAAVAKVLAAADQAHNAALDRLFVQDSAPLWEPKLYARSVESESTWRADFDSQRQSLLAYLARERGLVALQAGIWFALIVCFLWARRRTRAWVEAEPKLRHSTRIFEMPLASATLVALACTPLLYQAGPRALFTLGGALLVVPMLIIIRRLIDRSLMPLTWALALFYVAGLAREATAAVPFLPRVIFPGEMIGAAFFCLWLVKLSRFSETPGRGLPVRWRAVRAGAYLGVLAFAFAVVANGLGYFNLALFVGRAVLASVPEPR